MFRSERFKIKVYIDIRNNNTSSNTNKAIMSSQNTMAKESYPYKIIQSGYAPSSSHKIFISCTTPISAKHLFSYSIFSNLSTFTQYMSVSHGHSTMGGIERWLWRRQKGGRQSHIDQAYQRAMEMPINRYQCE